MSLEVVSGSFLAVLGSNGAGKTTLLRILATLERPQHGSAWVQGHNVESHRAASRAAVGLVAHQPLLYQDLTAAENLRFFATLHGRAATNESIAAALGQVGLDGLGDVRVRALSHGLVQRVAIARALLHQPSVVLADEPHAGLDPDAAGALDDTLAGLAATGRTVVLTTHDVDRARQRADTLAVLEAGRLAWLGPAASFPGWRQARSGAFMMTPPDLTFPRIPTDPTASTGQPGAVNPDGPKDSSVPTAAASVEPPPPLAGRAPHMPRPTFAAVVRAVVAKDVWTELRAREAVPLAVVFGTMLAVLFRFAVPEAIGGLGPSQTGTLLLPGALWISLVFGTTLGLGRAADAEIVDGGATACVLSPADPGALFIGKWLSGLALGCVVAAVLASASIVFLNAPTIPVAALGVVTLAGLSGWVAAATLVAAMVAGARSREALAPLILLPLATPLVIAAVEATAAVLAGAGLREMAPVLTLLGAYDVIFLVAGFLAYGYVLEVSS